MACSKKRGRSATPSSSAGIVRTKRRKPTDHFQQNKACEKVPGTQSALLLRAIRQPYELIGDHSVPATHHDFELLVKIHTVGLNPIDWKAPSLDGLTIVRGLHDYNFGIPVLPYIAGRELSGLVVKAPKSPKSRIQLGDVVIVPSTDYRDLRKAAYQQYSIASAFNTIRLPKCVSINSGSILGVAFVSAALALGVCMGINFDSIEGGPNLLSILRGIEPDRLATDVRGECLGGISSTECARAGDFLVIWGGSSTCAFVANQLARLAGLKIISIVDSAKHGLRLSGAGVRPDLVVDSHHPERAIEIIKSATKDRPSFGFDTQGKETAVHLIRALSPPSLTVHALTGHATNVEHKGNKLPTPPSTPLDVVSRRQHSHVVGLTGLPKTDIPKYVALHNVPIKVFHEIPEMGEALCAWCERLLLEGLLVPPDVVGVVDGLVGINAGLDRMRRREVSGGRLVAVLS